MTLSPLAGRDRRQVEANLNNTACYSHELPRCSELSQLLRQQIGMMGQAQARLISRRCMRLHNKLKSQNLCLALANIKISIDPLEYPPHQQSQT